MHFDKDSDVPHMPEMAMLNDISESENAKNLRISVVGHTDSRGSVEHNRDLSKRRTWSVINHLLLSGFRPYNIVFEYQGEECTDGEQDEQTLAENRRVDILISNVGPLEEVGFAGIYGEESFDRPLPGVVSDAEVFVINAEESNCIETASGTLIDIPPMAFVDAYGRPISGEVEVAYKEYNDPFSIFLSGITMKYQAGGMVENFESAGMFSLSASQRKRPVELRADKPVSMDFVSASSEDDFDFFFLDPNTSAWNNIGQASIRQDNAALKEEVQNISEAVVSYLAQTDYMAPSKASRTTLEEHFLNVEYMHARPIASYYRFLRKGNEKESHQFKRLWNKEANFETRLLPKRRKNDADAIYFKVQRKLGSGYNKEWTQFNYHTWEYDGALGRKQLKEMLGRKRFHNLRVRYDAANQTVSLELKNLDSIAHIPVKKVTIENASADLKKRMWAEFAPAYQKARLRNLNRSFELRYRIYKRSLDKQEKAIQSNADRYDKDAQRNYQKSLRAAWKESRPLMTEAERMMDMGTWMAYTTDRSNMLQEYYIKQKKGESVVRSLVVGRMGIYNCDRIIELKNPQVVSPRFVLADGKAVDWKSAYVFDEKLNGVIMYDRAAGNTITLSPKKLKTIIVTDEDGRTYNLNESEAIAMNKSKVAQRIMHVSEFDHTPNSLDEMREMLGSAGE